MKLSSMMRPTRNTDEDIPVDPAVAEARMFGIVPPVEEAL